MSTITVKDAAERLSDTVGELPVEDLLQVYNELFPEEPTTEEEAYEDMIPLVEQIIDHISGGLEPEEVVDLWNVVFPSDREVYFDEVDNLLHFARDGAAI